MKIAIAVILALGIGLAGYIYLAGDSASAPVGLAGDESGKALVEITVPATLSSRLCHINTGRPDKSTPPVFKQPQFHATQRMQWCAFEEEPGERLSGVAD